MEATTAPSPREATETQRSDWIKIAKDARRRYRYGMRAVTAGIEIRPYEESDVETIVEFSLRAWEPVFESMQRVLGDAIFTRLHQPDWRAAQAEAVRSSCATSAERDVFVAVADGRPVGFAAVVLNVPRAHGRCRHHRRRSS